MKTFKVKCKGCGKKIDASNYICPYCQSDNSLGDGEITALYLAEKKKRFKIRLISIISVIAALVLIGVILYKNLMLFPHQYQARMNRKAVRAYVAEYYSGAALVEENFNSIKNYRFLAVPPMDTFIYELNGVEFEITAQFAGDLISDDYADRRSFSSLEELLWYGFFVQKKFKKEDVWRSEFSKNSKGTCCVDVYVGEESDTLSRELADDLNSFCGYMIYDFPEQSGNKHIWCTVFLDLNGTKYRVFFDETTHFYNRSFSESFIVEKQ